MMREKRSIPWLIVAVVSGLSLFGLIGCIIMAALLPVIVDGPEIVASALALVSGGLVALGLAVFLLGTGVRGWLGHLSPTTYTRRLWMGLLLGWLGIAVTALLLAPSPQLTLPFVLLYLGMIVLPALLLLTLVTRTAGREPALTQRQTALALGAGAFSTLLAIPLEVVGFLLSLLVVSMGAMLFPGGQAEIARLSLEIERWMQSPAAAIPQAELAAVVTSPFIIVLLILTLALITPIVEEIVKTLVVAVVGYRERPGALRAFLWGAACGIGFALIEGSLNGGLGLSETGEWLSGVAVRVPATAMHALLSGLTGLGWGLFWRGRRWPLPLLYLLAMTFHGLWNFSAIGLLGGISSTEFTWEALSSPAMVLPALSSVVIVLLFIVALGGLIGVPVWMRFLQRRAAESTRTAALDAVRP